MIRKTFEIFNTMIDHQFMFQLQYHCLEKVTISLVKSLTADKKLTPLIEYTWKVLDSKMKSPSDGALLELKKGGE